MKSPALTKAKCTKHRKKSNDFMMTRLTSRSKGREEKAQRPLASLCDFPMSCPLSPLLRRKLIGEGGRLTHRTAPVSVLTPLSSRSTVTYMALCSGRHTFFTKTFYFHALHGSPCNNIQLHSGGGRMGIGKHRCSWI